MCRTNKPATVIAPARGALFTPPPGIPQLPGLASLLPNFFFGQFFGNLYIEI